jgi:hypothetical protein
VLCCICQRSTLTVYVSCVCACAYAYVRSVALRCIDKYRARDDAGTDDFSKRPSTCQIDCRPLIRRPNLYSRVCISRRSIVCISPTFQLGMFMSLRIVSRTVLGSMWDAQLYWSNYGSRAYSRCKSYGARSTFFWKSCSNPHCNQVRFRRNICLNMSKQLEYEQARDHKAIYIGARSARSNSVARTSR